MTRETLINNLQAHYANWEMTDFVDNGKVLQTSFFKDGEKVLDLNEFGEYENARQVSNLDETEIEQIFIYLSEHLNPADKDIKEIKGA